jgi:hypothetical protein
MNIIGGPSRGCVAMADNAEGSIITKLMVTTEYRLNNSALTAGGLHPGALPIRPTPIAIRLLESFHGDGRGR